jgi:hypothetical protein
MDQFECNHHWVIDSAEGPTSRGRCKLCGTERSFSNLYQDLRLDSQKRKAEAQAHRVQQLLSEIRYLRTPPTS